MMTAFLPQGELTIERLCSRTCFALITPAIIGQPRLQVGHSTGRASASFARFTRVPRGARGLYVRKR